MSSKNNTEVILGGKVFTLSGYESEEYLQKVASILITSLLSTAKKIHFADRMRKFVLILCILT